MNLAALAASSTATILRALGQTCTIGSDIAVPCAFNSTADFALHLFAEQDTDSGKLLVCRADISAVPEIQSLVTAPDGNDYRIKTINEDGYGATILFTLEDPTGPLRG